MPNQSTIIEFWEFLRVRKRYWLFPIVILLLLIGFLIVFVESSSVAPFIYAIFWLEASQLFQWGTTGYGLTYIFSETKGAGFCDEEKN